MTAQGADKLPTPPEDFRRRVAAQRRERMRAHLLDELLNLYQPGAQNDALVIDDVLKAANVARGTFYKYFPSLDAASLALGEQLTTEMINNFQRLYADIDDPAVRAMGGMLIVCVRSWHEPKWGVFTGHVDFISYFERNNGFDLMVRDGLLKARETGLMQFDDIDAAVDMLMGTSIEARRRMVRRPPSPRAYVDNLLHYIFRGLSMQPRALSQALNASWDCLLDNAAAAAWMDDPAMWRNV